MQKFIYLIIFVFCFNHVESQNKIAEPSNPFESYDEYFKMSRESLYLHLNKSSYLRGENIWFQGYAYDRKTQRLNPETRNVEVGVYNAEGKILDKKLFLARNGLFSGQIPIDSTFLDGNYYLKAETNYMKNFKEDYAHVQAFEVIGEEQISENQKVDNFDLQILPEGGHSVINCVGNLGIKLINAKGLGVKFKGDLFENDVPIRNFTSNKFGHAKVEFMPMESKTYHLEVAIPNGKTLKQKVENIKPNGYDLNVNNQISGKTIVQISSNLPKGYNYKDANAYLMVHQEGKQFFIKLYFSEEVNKISKIISTNQLFSGVNTLTLFVNGKPIAERLIFNNNNIIDNSEEVDIVQQESAIKDSLSFELFLPKLNTGADISISVLPEETLSYKKNQNIASALLLKPFVTGYIEDESYYFTNTDRRTSYNLDLLMLTQGWSQYSWDNILSNPPEYAHMRLDGLTQNVTITSKLKKTTNELLLFNTMYNEGLAVKVRKDSLKSFQLNKRYPIIGEKMEFSFLNDKKIFKRPDLIVKTYSNLTNDRLKEDQLKNPLSDLREIKLELKNEKLYANFLQGEKLDTVFLTSKVEKKERLRNDYITSFKGNTLKVTEEVVATYNTLADYLATKGYMIKENFNDSVRENRFQIQSMSRMSVNAGLSPAIFLDGVLLSDFVVLSGARMSDFEEVYVDRSGYNMGVQGTNGVIRLERRRTPLFTEATEIQSRKENPTYYHTVLDGFEASKQFYMPKYAMYTSETFQQVGTIAWFPNLSIPVDGSVNIEIFNTGLKSFQFFIEGIAKDGTLINVKRTVKL